MIKVNSQWYNQAIKNLKNESAREKMQIRFQFYRYRDAKNGKKQQFDIDRNISTDRLFEYLNNAIHKVGRADISLKKFIKKYEPCESIKTDWKAIKNEIKNFGIKNTGVLCSSDDEFLEFFGSFFSAISASSSRPSTRINVLSKSIMKYLSPLIIL